MKLLIKLRIKEAFGRRIYYPDNEAAVRLAQWAKQDTLSQRQVDLLQAWPEVQIELRVTSLEELVEERKASKLEAFQEIFKLGESDEK